MDVVIVGAGLAGLACAYELRDKRILLLEKNSCAGGRVLTREFQGFHVDMGACFAIDAQLLPKEFVPDLGTLIKERGPIGICEDGRTVYADTPVNCLASLRLDELTRSHITDFANGRLNADSLVGTRAYRLLNALLHQIHPGELVDYAPEFQRHGFHNWFPDHWQAGNSAVVDSFVKHSFAKECPAELLLNTGVTRIEELPGGVKIYFNQAGEEKCATASAAVLAAPANETVKLIQQQNKSQYHDLLTKMRYGNFTVVSMMGTDLHKLPEFRYIVIADQTLSMLVQQRSVDRRHTMLLCYYNDNACKSVVNMTDNEIIAFTQRELIAAGLDSDVIHQVDTAFVHRWIPGGTVLSAEYLLLRDRLPNPLGNRLFLSGDYLSPMGYGTIGALSSGQHTANMVRELLE